MSIFDEYDKVRPGRLAAWVIGFIAAVVLIAVGAWAFRVATAPAKGAGDVRIKNNDANNRIAAQAEFNKLWSDIQSYHSNIQSAAAVLKTNPADAYQQSVLTSEQQICRTAVNQYNADTLNVTMKDWRPSEDPASVDSTQECETTP